MRKAADARSLVIVENPWNAFHEGLRRGKANSLRSVAMGAPIIVFTAQQRVQVLGYIVRTGPDSARQPGQAL